jgi:uncharacterized protein
MNESIKQLLQLQQRDAELDRMNGELSSIPATIASLRGKIQENKLALENAKKDQIQLQLAKKQKDLDLDAQEAAVRKHTTELNSVKSNEMYKALLSEIDKAKQSKSTLEDQILEIMEKTDQATKVWKDKESSAKGIEADLQKQIGDCEAKQKEIEGQISAKAGEREASAGQLPKALGTQYSRLREGKRTNPVAPIRNEQCSGCHMKVSQNLINEVRRGLKLMSCENCSRIVYLEEDATAVPAPGSRLQAPESH